MQYSDHKLIVLHRQQISYESGGSVGRRKVGDPYNAELSRGTIS
jgi:hypothetical protein